MAEEIIPNQIKVILDMDIANNNAKLSNVTITNNNGDTLSNITDTVNEIVLPSANNNGNDDDDDDNNNQSLIDNISNENIKKSIYDMINSNNTNPLTVNRINNFFRKENRDITPVDNIIDLKKEIANKWNEKQTEDSKKIDITTITGGKRRRKTSKRSSGGKRKTAKYQKRKSGKYRQ